MIVLASAVIAADGSVAAAQADPAPISALLLRNADTTIFREPAGSTTMTMVQGVYSWQGTDYPTLEINSQVGTDTSTDEPVAITAGLAPGTYATSRIPEAAPVILDPGPIAPCGGDEPGTLTVQQADYDNDGNPIDFAASFDIDPCDGRGVVHGEIRWNSTTPLELAQAPEVTSVPAPVFVGSTTEVTVPFRSVGNSPATMGAATLSQTPMSDGTLDWSIVDDGCSGQTLAPGDTCSVTARIAPIRPDGVPSSTVYATVEIPDGQSIAASAQVTARVFPLSGQALDLQARGAFRQIALTWEPPQAAPAGWSVFHQQYSVYRYSTDGSLDLLGSTQGHTFVVTGLPDLYTARFVVRDEQSGAAAPLSVAATATTASKELIYIAGSANIFARRLAPQPETTPSTAITSTTTFNGAGSFGLTVARNQSALAYVVNGSSDSPPTTAYVCAAHLDEWLQTGYCSGADLSPSNQWDTGPSLSPDGTRIVFTHAATPGAATALEIASTATRAKAAAVPNSSGLHDATFNAAGTGLVAVQAVGASTELVALSLTGTRTVIAGSVGLSDPDVAANGQIVAVETGSDTPPTTSLVLLRAGASAPLPIAGAQTGTNVRPRFAADGQSVYYTHDDVPQIPTAGYGDELEVGDADQVDLASGVVSVLAGTGSAGTPDILTADGTHGLDTAAPAVRMVAPAATVDLATTALASWTGTDAPAAGQIASGVRSYDARYRTASVGHTFGAYVYPSAWQATTNYGATMRVTAGYEYCFSARARDIAGNVSAWTPDRCTVSPLDDRSLHTTARRLSSSSYYLHTYSYATAKSTRFTLAGVSSRRVGILATTCASCGEVQVTLGARTLGRINTHAGSTHYRQALWLPTTATAATGTLTITTLSTTPVRIDGIVLGH